MQDLNDRQYFVAVVRHGGFSAAARAIGIEKTRLSRRITALEKDIGVRLLQRTTRTVALTAAGKTFFDRCIAVVDGANEAFDSIAEMRREAAGLVRVSCPVLLTQRCLAHAIPDYLAKHPKVRLLVEPTDRMVNLVEEGFDIAIRAKPVIENVAGLVARILSHSARVMVVSPAFLRRFGYPKNPADLRRFATVASIDDAFDGGARWALINNTERQQVELQPRLVTSDLRVRLQCAVRGIGIALLPEQVASGPLQEGQIERVLPEWSGASNILHLVYPTRRGMLPSVKTVIEFLVTNVAAWLEDHRI